MLTVVTGVAGSGQELADPRLAAGGADDVIVVDQSAIRGSRRSNPATYTGLLDPIRTAFAKANGVKAALFSANSEGACPNCKGIGLVYTDLAMMAGVASVCEQCEGKRFTPEVLTYKLRGKDISEVLAMSVDRGAGVLHRPARPATILDRLADVGLGYLALGPAADHAVRRRAAAAQAGHPHGREGVHLRAGRADHAACTWPTSTSCWPCSTGWSTTATR